MLTTSCHCGAVRLEFATRPRQMTECNCSICRRYGALWSYAQRRRLTVVAEPSDLHRYPGRDGKLVFMRCARCGCVTHYEQAVRRADGTDMAAVNMRNVGRPEAIAALPVRLIDGAESWKILDRAPRPYTLRSPRADRPDDG